MSSPSTDPALTVVPEEARHEPPSLSTLWRVWFALGLQSFGGGSATFTLIRRAMVEEHLWITEEEFTYLWALVQIAPGINLLGLTILLGRRLAGWKGVGIALIGLLLPSVAVTILLTACYAQVRRYPIVQAAIQGMLPATLALGLLTTVQMVLPLLVAARRQGPASLMLSLVLLVGSGAIVSRFPVLFILFLAGAIGGGASWLRQPAASLTLHGVVEEVPSAAGHPGYANTVR